MLFLHVSIQSNLPDSVRSGFLGRVSDCVSTRTLLMNHFLFYMPHPLELVLVLLCISTSCKFIIHNVPSALVLSVLPCRFQSLLHFSPLILLSQTFLKNIASGLPQWEYSSNIASLTFVDNWYSFQNRRWPILWERPFLIYCCSPNDLFSSLHIIAHY